MTRMLQRGIATRRGIMTLAPREDVHVALREGVAAGDRGGRAHDDAHAAVRDGERGEPTYVIDSLREELGPA